MSIQNNIKSIFNSSDFEQTALAVFRYQVTHNLIYKKYVDLLGVDVLGIKSISAIPFLPIEFFKSHIVICENEAYEMVFKSSGTTGSARSSHFVKDLNLYKESFRKCFQYFYGSIKKYHVLALLPNYLEQGASSLVYMIQDFITESDSINSGFYLNNLEELSEKLYQLNLKKEKVFLIGVSYALLDLIAHQKFELGENVVVLETGGMKGRRKELIKSELHQRLKKGFGVENIHSEYGMTELLSQAYSFGNGLFKTPTWMKTLIREVDDPLQLAPINKTGGINIIDLANVHSCSFIATEDLGKIHQNGEFEVLGRLDKSDVRGCNLMIGNE